MTSAANRLRQLSGNKALVSGFWRNLLTVVLALFKRDSAILQTGCFCNFWVTPFDVGVQTLKSDKYLQLVEAAQLDFGVRSGLLKRMQQASCSMVNVEQQINFVKPITLLNRVCIQTNIVFADARFVHFHHVFSVGNVTCSNVVVKAKFKAGRITQSAVEMTRFDRQASLAVPADLSVSAKPQSAQ